MSAASSAPPRLTRYAWLSIAAALATMGMKAVAYLVTGSVGLLSDALESTVNLVAGIVALIALAVAARPPDESHAYGHGKAEYFSAGVEGAMILLAAGAIAVTAVQRLIDPIELERIGVGLVVSTAAAGINFVVAVVLTRAGRRHRSITLEADGKHLMTDVWTSGGVLVGVGLVAITGWDRLDPIVALGVAANILVAGWVLVRRSAAGLMDMALSDDERAAVDAVLDRYRAHDCQYHAVRSRQSGQRRFLSLHLLVPGAWSVQRGHDLCERLEGDLRAAVPGLTVEIHLEPLEDPASFADENLDRGNLPPSARPGTGRSRPDS